VIPVSISAPPNSQLVFIAHARGFQIYLCRPEGWVLKAPEALLYDQQGNVIGKHFAGPTWRHHDGSQIGGKLAAKADSPDSRAIPWLLLDVTSRSGDGVFSRVTSIQRINTVGGLPPASACADSSRETEHKSSYSADYYFYAPK
jgi:Protein of unknown function (DUF3455)